MATTEILDISTEDVVDKRTAELGEETGALRLSVSDFPDIQAPAGRSEAVALLSDIKHRLKAATEIREFFVKPVRDLATRYREKFKPPIDLLEGAERALKRKIGEYDMRIGAERRRRDREVIEAAQAAERAQEKKAKALEKKGEPEAAQAVRSVPIIPIAPAPAPPPASRSTSTRVKFTAKVVDEEAVPRRFLMVDLKALEAYAKRYKDQTPPKVPGIRWHAEPIVTHRGRPSDVPL